MTCPVCGRDDCNFLHDRPGGVRILTLKEKELAMRSTQYWRSDKRLYINADRSRIVEESDPDAAYLYATPGKLVPMDEAIRYGLAGKQDAEKVEVPANVEDDQKPETSAKAVEPSEDKMVRLEENKSAEPSFSDDDDVTVINGIGAGLAKQLASINVRTVGEFKRKGDRDILELGGISPARLREFRDQVG